APLQLFEARGDQHPRRPAPADRGRGRERQELRTEIARRSEGKARGARARTAPEGRLMGQLGQRGRRLGRDTGARTALFRGLLASLIVYERISTTESKAKETKKVA